MAMLKGVNCCGQLWYLRYVLYVYWWQMTAVGGLTVTHVKEAFITLVTVGLPSTFRDVAVEVNVYRKLEYQRLATV